MPRSLPAQQAKAITKRRYSPACRVRIKDSTGAFQDLRSFLGKNWVTGVEYGDDVDEPVASASVHLFRDRSAISLAPLVETSKANLLTGSYAPLIDAMREIVIETAVLPEGVAVQSGDWLEVFRGFIDRTSWAGKSKSELGLECRDLAGPLADIFLEKEGRPSGSAYGTDPSGRPVEEVMQDVLDDWATPAGYSIVLYTPTGTLVDPRPVGERSGYNVVSWPAPKGQSVLDTIRSFANFIGYDVRVRWSSVTNTMRLEMFNPPRANTTPDVTIGPGVIRDVQRLEVDPSSIRNAIVVTYQTTSDSEDTRTESTTATDATSIAKYRRRWMEVCTAASAGINTATEANKMRDAILSDLKDPKAELVVEAPYRPDLVLNDLVRWSPDAKHFTSNQDLACISLRHRIEPDGKAETVIATRGRPCGQYANWLLVQGKPGFGDGKRTFPGKAPGTVTLAATVGGMTINIDASNLVDRDILHFEYHVSTTNGFTPDRATSSATRVARGTMTRVEVQNLTPGTTYYVKVLTVRRDGVVSAASTQQFTVPVKLGTSLLDKLDYLDLKDQGAGVLHRRIRDVDGTLQFADQSNTEQAGAVRLKEPVFKDSTSSTDVTMKNSGGIFSALVSGAAAVLKFAKTKMTQALSVVPPATDGNPYFCVIDDDSTNYLTNPSFEVDTAGWSAVSTATLARVTSTAVWGVASCEETIPTGAVVRGMQSANIAAAVGEQWVFSGWLVTDAGGKVCRLRIEFLNATPAVIQTTDRDFTPGNASAVRDFVLATAPANTAWVRVSVLNNGADQGNFKIYADGLQLEKGRSKPTSYLDGSLGPGYAWTGTAHASTSTREAGMHFLEDPRNGSFVIDEQGIVDIGTYLKVGTPRSYIYVQNDKYSGGTPSIYILGTDADANLNVGAAGAGDLFLTPIGMGRYTLIGSGACFSAVPAAATTLTSGAYTPVTFGTEEFDLGNDFASSVFTAPEAGIYEFHAHERVGTANANKEFVIRLEKDTGGGYAAWREGDDYVESAQPWSGGVHVIGALNFNDKVRVTMFNGDSVNRATAAAGYFQGKRIA